MVNLKILMIPIVIVAIVAVAISVPLFDTSDDDISTSQTSTTTTTTTSTSTTTKEMLPDSDVIVINIEATEYLFNVSNIQVSKGDTVRITLTNAGSDFHNFVIPDLDIQTEVVSPRNSDTIEFIAEETGVFDFECSIGNHRALGMLGKIIVE